MVPVAHIVTGVTFVCTFHIRPISAECFIHYYFININIIINISFLFLHITVFIPVTTMQYYYYYFALSCVEV